MARVPRGCVAALLAGSVAGVMVVAGCGSDGGGSGAPTTTSVTSAGPTTPTTPPPPPPTIAPGTACPDPAAKPVRFPRADGGQLGGVLLGASGTVGVVLGHEHPEDLCNWVPYGKRLAARGYRVLALDFATYGSSRQVSPLNLTGDVAAAAAYLKTQGAQRFVLMGASMGGSAVVAAAPSVPSVLAVVSLSGPRSFLGADAGAAAPRLRVPLMCVAAIQDMGGDFLDAARTTCAQNGAAGPRQLVTIQGAGHGTQLVSVPDSPASQAIDALLARYAMP